jgi:potassium-transporting ATPase KdpC subunit
VVNPVLQHDYDYGADSVGISGESTTVRCHHPAPPWIGLITVSSFLRRLLATTRMIFVLVVVCGVVYPLVVLGVSQARAHDHADEPLVPVANGTVGSALLVQGFTENRWFHGRTSASANVVSASGRSTLTPSREQQRQAIDDRRAELMKANPDAPGTVPDDALTVSPGGQEASVSTAYALWQVPRVAKARHVPELQVRRLIQRHTEEHVAGFLGEPRVNILELNLALGGELPKR